MSCANFSGIRVAEGPQERAIFGKHLSPLVFEFNNIHAAVRSLFHAYVHGHVELALALALFPAKGRDVGALLVQDHDAIVECVRYMDAAVGAWFDEHAVGMVKVVISIARHPGYAKLPQHRRRAPAAAGGVRAWTCCRCRSGDSAWRLFVFVVCGRVRGTAPIVPSPLVRGPRLVGSRALHHTDTVSALPGADRAPTLRSAVGVLPTGARRMEEGAPCDRRSKGGGHKAVVGEASRLRHADTTWSRKSRHPMN